MNSKNRYIPFLFLMSVICTAILILAGCERDDICAEDTPTTPLLIIQFFDFDTRIDSKAPNNLSVRSADLSENFISNSDQDSIAIPLKTNADITDFRFTIDVNDSVQNIDSLSFEYTAVEEYVSSACGFKINYEGLTFTLIEEEDQANNNWIKEVVRIESNITDENTTHIFIYH